MNMMNFQSRKYRVPMSVRIWSPSGAPVPPLNPILQETRRGISPDIMGNPESLQDATRDPVTGMSPDYRLPETSEDKAEILKKFRSAHGNIATYMGRSDKTAFEAACDLQAAGALPPGPFLDGFCSSAAASEMPIATSHLSISRVCQTWIEERRIRGKGSRQAFPDSVKETHALRLRAGLMGLRISERNAATAAGVFMRIGLEAEEKARADGEAPACNATPVWQGAEQRLAIDTWKYHHSSDAFQIGVAAGIAAAAHLEQVRTRQWKRSRANLTPARC